VQDTNTNNPQRRASDETLDEILKELRDIKQRQEEICTAFTLDDLKKPDFSGHRKKHLDLDKAHDTMDKYKSDATKRFIDIVVTALCTLILAGLYSWFKLHS
jgi:patatin-like phospholipase/acyl hydrolase